MVSTVLCAALTLVSMSQSNLSTAVENTVSQTLKQYESSGLKPDELCVSAIRLDRSQAKQAIANVNGDKNMYPASVVKLFYAAFLAKELDNGKIKRTEELDRAVKDMLVESSNDATGLVLDVITGTTGGPELPPKALAAWMKKRQVVNEWLKGRGYQNVNACQKTWNEGPYGREKQGYGPKMELRNSLSANATTQIMAELILRQIAGEKASSYIQGFMTRVTQENDDDVGNQTKGFLGQALPPNWLRVSKAGWAYQVRHDVIYFKTEKGSEYVVTVFTDHHGNDATLLPSVMQLFLKNIGER